MQEQSRSKRSHKHVNTILHSETFWNAFNTVIETAVSNGEVLWTLVEGERGIIDKWVEHINGGYTGTQLPLTTG